jgi:hypothetical protein
MRNNTRQSPYMATGRGALRVALAAGAVALLAAGCSSGSSNSNNASSNTNNNTNTNTGTTPLHAIQLAADTAKTANSETATISAVVNTSGVNATVAGTVDIQIRPTLYEDANFTKFSETSLSMPGGMREILTPTAAYVKMALLSEMTHKPWVEISYASLAQTSGIDLRPMIQQAQNDSPLTQTQMLAAATNVTKVGTSTVDGVSVTEYTGTFPIGAGLKRLPASMRAKLDQSLSAAGLSTAHFQVWLDSNNQARKVIISMHSTELTETVTMDVTSINQPVTQYIPPASQVGGLPHGA